MSSKRGLNSRTGTRPRSIPLPPSPSGYIGGRGAGLKPETREAGNRAIKVTAAQFSKCLIRVGNFHSAPPQQVRQVTGHAHLQAVGYLPRSLSSLGATDSPASASVRRLASRFHGRSPPGNRGTGLSPGWSGKYLRAVRQDSERDESNRPNRREVFGTLLRICPEKTLGQLNICLCGGDPFTLQPDVPSRGRDGSLRRLAECLRIGSWL
jgi:hypothetical protein